MSAAPLLNSGLDLLVTIYALGLGLIALTGGVDLGVVRMHEAAKPLFMLLLIVPLRIALGGRSWLADITEIIVRRMTGWWELVRARRRRRTELACSSFRRETRGSGSRFWKRCPRGPVVAADRGALPEVLEDAGLLVDPDDVNGLAQAIHRMLTDEAFAIVCAERGLVRAQQFSWASAAMALHRAYEAAHANRRRDSDNRRD